MLGMVASPLEKGEGEGEGYPKGKREKPKNPSPLSSPLRKGRGETGRSAALLGVNDCGARLLF
jgi:hypothetical protein